MNRRSFLRSAATLGAGATLAPAAMAQTPIKRVGGPSLKPGLNAYSFSKALNDNVKGRGKGMSLLDLLAYCAEQQCDALDPTGYFFPGYPKPPSDKYINDFKRRAHELGIAITGTGIRNNFAAPEQAKRAADVKHAKEWIEVAARLGAPVLRVFSGNENKEKTFADVAPWISDCIREVAEQGEKFGVLVGLQNHWDAVKTPDQVLDILKRVNSTWLGTIVDTGYFLTDDPYRDMAMIAPYAVNWQVKENVGGKQAKNVKTDLLKVVRVAKESGYRGYLPIETLTTDGPEGPLVQVPRLLKELKSAIAAVG